MRSYTVVLALLAVAVLLLAAVAGLGSRWGWWHFRTGFSLLRWAVYAAIALLPLSLAGLVFALRRRSRQPAALAALALGVAVLLVANALQWRARGRAAPPIHDITTDTGNPPTFEAIVPLRAAAPNPVEYAGGDIAAQQRAAYPDIQPITLAMPPDQAFAEALAAARRMGWQIVAANEAARRIEATDRTRWFGFHDDIVIRVSAQPDAAASAIVDVRSTSRVGRSDLGTNARRIRAYARELTGR